MIDVVLVGSLSMQQFDCFDCGDSRGRLCSRRRNVLGVDS